MRMLNRILILLSGIALVIPMTASAHHSTAMYDQSETIVMDAIVTKWSLRNPHSILKVTRVSDDVPFVLDGGAVPLLFRLGYRRDSFEVGEKVQVMIWPRLDGEPGGIFLAVIKADGSCLGMCGPGPGGGGNGGEDGGREESEQVTDDE